MPLKERNNGCKLKESEPISGKKSAVRMGELDALRGIAALVVVFFHFTMDKEQYNTIYKLGTTGVDLFFMISGFVIFMSLNAISRSMQFFINRFSRLYPAYWAAVTLTFLLILAVRIMRHTPINIFYVTKKYIANLTMLQFYLGVPNIDSPYWTLLIELLFYAAMLMLYKFKLLKHVNVIGIVIILFTTISVGFLYNFYPVQKVLKFIPLLQFAPLFLAGINFYKLYTNKQSELKNYLIIIFCLLAQISLFKYIGRSKSYINIYEYAGMLSLYFILFTAFIGHRLHFIVGTHFFSAKYLMHYM